MKPYIRHGMAAQVHTLFPEADAETVLSWWIANEGRRPVIVVGAGFTRNAVYKTSSKQVESVDAPLWKDVSRAFAEDLRIQDAAGIDPLALAEMHRDGMGDRRFCDLLRDLLPDEKLAPGDAHRALFGFDAEAIITTNFMDTLLDNHPHAVPIFDDIDVARRGTGPRRVEILYLHGHRSSPATWVISRSQYEDLSTSRPTIFARVRQLLSQHPVLIVGFGLADPDFHQIYRQVSLDMKVRNPLGLALLGPLDAAERGSEHESALRRHWERLGIRLARFKDWSAFGTKFVRFFSIANRMSIDDLKAILKTRNLAERTDVARSALEDPDIDKYVETWRGWQNAIWRHCIDAEFNELQRNELRQRMNSALRGDWPQAMDEQRDTSAPRIAQSEATQDFKTKTFRGRIRKHWELAWLLDDLLDTRQPTIRLLIIRWVALRVRGNFWEQRDRGHGDHDLDLAALLSAAWGGFLDDQSSDTAPYRSEAIADLQCAHQLCARYGADEVATFIAQQLHAMGAAPPPTAPPSPAADHMKKAFHSMMNGAYAEAASQYTTAINEAAGAEDALLRWLAAAGAHDATARAARERRSSGAEEDSAVDLRNLERAVSRFEADPIVVAWQEEAQQRVNELQRNTIRAQQERRRTAGFERQSFSSTSVPHFAWRALRDLETRDAPPGIQERYLMPLLHSDSFDIEEALEWRLRFGIEKSAEWIDDCIDRAEGSNDEAHKRNRKLLDVWNKAWRAASATKTTLLACVQTLPALLEVVSDDDEVAVHELLGLATSRLGTRVYGYRGWSWVVGDIAQAWCRTVTHFRSPASFERMRKATQDHQWLRSELSRAIDEFPWYALFVLKATSISAATRWICEILAPANSSIGKREQESVGQALVAIVEAGANKVDQPTWDRVAAWCNEAMTAPPTERSFGWLGPIIQLCTAKRRHDGKLAGVWAELDERCFRLVSAQRAVALAGGDLNAIVSSLWCLAVAADKNWTTGWSEIADEAWNHLLAEWPKYVGFLKANIFTVPRVGWFLATLIRGDVTERRSAAADLLLAIWPISASIRYVGGALLEPRYWTELQWLQVLRNLRGAFGGGGLSHTSSWRIAASAMLKRALLTSKHPPAQLVALSEMAASLVSHEEALVANHAAYTTIYAAEQELSEAQAELFCGALELVANDTRISVRQAAAYGANRLKVTARHPAIARWAAEGAGKLANANYALIGVQARLGAAEAEAQRRPLELGPPAPIPLPRKKRRRSAASK